MKYTIVTAIITIQLRLFVCCSMGGELRLGCPATLTPLPRDTAVGGGRGSRGHGGHQVSQHHYIPVSQSFNEYNRIIKSIGGVIDQLLMLLIMLV